MSAPYLRIGLISVLSVVMWGQASPWSIAASRAKAAREAENVPEAIAQYKKAVTLNPAWAEGWWYLGTIYYQTNQWAPCRDAFRKFTALEPKAGAGLALMGQCEFSLKEYGPALQHLEHGRSLGLPQGSPILYSSLYASALLLTRLENYERALFLLSSITQQQAETPESVMAAGIAALRRPIPPEAVPAEDRELVIRTGRAFLLAAARKAVEAKALFEELIADYPKVPNLHYTYGTFLLAGESDLAVEQFKKELELNPDHLPSLVTMSLELLARADSAAALPFAKRAVAIAPGNFTTHTALGKILLDQDDAAGAVKELELAVKIAPDSPQARYALASAYAKAGRKVEAAREREAFAKLKKAQGQ